MTTPQRCAEAQHALVTLEAYANKLPRGQRILMMNAIKVNRAIVNRICWKDLEQDEPT